MAAETLAPAAAASPTSLPTAAPGPLQLTAFDRILTPSPARDRTFLISLLIVLALHVVTLLGAIRFGADQPSRERIGQVDDPSSVAIELVTEPAKDTKSTDSQRGEIAPPTPTPIPDQKPPAPQQQPQREQQAQKAQPEQKKVADQTEPPPPTPADDGPAAAEQKQKPQEEAKLQEERQPQAPVAPSDAASPRLKVPGAAPNGHQSAYSKTVLNAIDDRWLLEFGLVKGEAYVEFELSRTGGYRYIKVAQSSGNRAFDDHLVALIKSVRMPVPPPGLPDQELAYQIHFNVK